MNVKLVGNISSDTLENLSSQELQAPLTVQIASMGGSVVSGFAIADLLSSIDPAYNVEVIGVAASMASVIACNTKGKIKMHPNAEIMVHNPFTMAAGDAKEFRRVANRLESLQKRIAGVYSKRTGLPTEEVSNMMDDETWLSASDAVEKGFADEEADSLEYVSMAKDFPSDLVFLGLAHEEPKVLKEGVNMEEIRAQERSRLLEIDKLQRHFTHVEAQVFEDAKALGTPVNEVRNAILDRLMTQKSEPVQHVQVVADAKDKQKDQIIDGLMQRAGLKQRDGNRYAECSIMDIARECASSVGFDTRLRSQTEILNAAIATSMSDFPVLMENVMHKALLSGYETQGYTWRQIVTTGSVSDFRPHNFYRTSSLGNLMPLNELGEYKYLSPSDGEKVSVTVQRKGAMLNISREAMINDDLGVLTTLASQLGRSVDRTIETDVWDTFLANPTMADGNALFSAAHNNYDTGAAASAITIQSLDAARVKMAMQKTIDGRDYLDIRPSILICHTSKRGDVNITLNSEYDHEGSTSRFMKPNKSRGIVSTILDTPRVPTNSWYLMASPSQYPTIMIAFLNGQQSPTLEQERPFETDGLRWKIRLEYGVNPFDWRVAYFNTGA